MLLNWNCYQKSPQLLSPPNQSPLLNCYPFWLFDSSRHRWPLPSLEIVFFLTEGHLGILISYPLKISPSISCSNFSLLFAECRHYLVGQHAQWSQVCTLQSIVLCLAQWKPSKHVSLRDKSLVPSCCCCQLSPLVYAEVPPPSAVFPAPHIHLHCRLPSGTAICCCKRGSFPLLIWELLRERTPSVLLL